MDAYATMNAYGGSNYKTSNAYNRQRLHDQYEIRVTTVPVRRGGTQREYTKRATNNQHSAPNKKHYPYRPIVTGKRNPLLQIGHSSIPLMGWMSSQLAGRP